jgi:hypothetical protein
MYSQTVGAIVALAKSAILLFCIPRSSIVPFLTSVMRMKIKKKIRITSLAKKRKSR